MSKPRWAEWLLWVGGGGWESEWNGGYGWIEDSSPYTVDQAVNSAMAEPQLVQTAGLSWGNTTTLLIGIPGIRSRLTGFLWHGGEYKGFYFGYGEFGWGCFGTDKQGWAASQARYAPQTGHMGTAYTKTWWGLVGGGETTWVVTNAGAARSGGLTPAPPKSSGTTSTKVRPSSSGPVTAAPTKTASLSARWTPPRANCKWAGPPRGILSPRDTERAERRRCRR